MTKQIKDATKAPLLTGSPEASIYTAVLYPMLVQEKPVDHDLRVFSEPMHINPLKASHGFGFIKTA